MLSKPVIPIPSRLVMGYCFNQREQLREMIENSKSWAKSRGLYVERSEVHGCEEWRIPTARSFEFTSTNCQQSEFTSRFDIQVGFYKTLSHQTLDPTSSPFILNHAYPLQDPDGALLQNDMDEASLIQ